MSGFLCAEGCDLRLGENGSLIICSQHGKISRIRRRKGQHVHSVYRDCFQKRGELAPVVRIPELRKKRGRQRGITAKDGHIQPAGSLSGEQATVRDRHDITGFAGKDRGTERDSSGFRFLAVNQEADGAGNGIVGRNGDRLHPYAVFFSRQGD